MPTRPRAAAPASPDSRRPGVANDTAHRRPSLRRRLFAAVYDRLSAGAEEALAPLRTRTAGRAHGAVLEIVDVAEAQGARLPYPDAAFDAVVASLVLCSVDDQRTVLAEVRRVLRPGGHFLFLEHVAAASPRVRAWQRRLSPVQRFFADGCELDHDTASPIRAGASPVQRSRRSTCPAHHYSAGS